MDTERVFEMMGILAELAMILKISVPTFAGCAPKSRPYKVGSLVKVVGLKNAVHLNGKRGVIMEPDNKNKGRWGVHLFPKSRHSTEENT